MTERDEEISTAMPKVRFPPGTVCVILRVIGFNRSMGYGLSFD